MSFWSLELFMCFLISNVCGIQSKEECQGELKNVSYIETTVYKTKQTVRVPSSPHHPTLSFGGSHRVGGDTPPLPTTRSNFEKPILLGWAVYYKGLSPQPNPKRESLTFRRQQAFNARPVFNGSR